MSQRKFSKEADAIVGGFKAKKMQAQRTLNSAGSNITVPGDHPDHIKQYTVHWDAYREAVGTSRDVAKDQIAQSAQRHLSPAQFGSGAWKRKQIF